VSSWFTDDDEPEPEGLEDEPLRGFLNFGVLEVITPEGQVALTIDLEIPSDHCMSAGEFSRRAAAEAGQQVSILAASPRFRQRFGNEPEIRVYFTGCIQE
jgi:hypothetical protein